MSLIIRQALAKNAQEKRAMQAQWDHVQELRNAGNPAMQAFLQMTNAGRSPAEAYREFDATTKIEVNPMGEFATLTRLMQKARPVNIGKTLYEYRKSSDMDNGQTSMSGQIGVKLDHTDYGYAGVIVPVHDTGFGRSWRDVEAMRSEGFDALVDDAREAELGLMRTMNSFLFAGNAGLSVDGQKWLGLTSGSESPRPLISAPLPLPRLRSRLKSRWPVTVCASPTTALIRFVLVYLPRQCPTWSGS